MQFKILHILHKCISRVECPFHAPLLRSIALYFCPEYFPFSFIPNYYKLVSINYNLLKTMTHFSFVFFLSLLNELFFRKSEPGIQSMLVFFRGLKVQDCRWWGISKSEVPQGRVHNSHNFEILPLLYSLWIPNWR